MVAYSGGKDSDTLRILCDLADVPYELTHHHTTVDAPETVRYVRNIPDIIITKPRYSMWQLIENKGIPPTRLKRYCCSNLKDQNGKDRFVMTGVRWGESPRRRNTRGIVEVSSIKPENRLILHGDNDHNRLLLENCVQKGRRTLNPIIDWTDDQVWEFLHHYGCDSNPLYQEGLSRIGCVGCFMAGQKRHMEFARWLKYKAMYIRAFQRMVDRHGYADTTDNWQDGESVFRWWMEDKNIPQINGQLSFLPD